MKTIQFALVILLSMAVASCGGGSSGSGGGGGGGTPPPTGNYKLTVTKSSASAGTVTSNPGSISCDTSCTTQSQTFASGTKITLTAVPNTNMGSTFTGWNGAGCSGVSTCPVTLSADTTVTANFAALSENTLGLFAESDGGSSSEFLGWDSSGNGITVDSNVYVYSMILPAAKQWVVLDTQTSVDYASHTIWSFEQDDQVFEVEDWETECTFHSKFNPHNVSLTDFELLNTYVEGPDGCDLQSPEVGIVGDSVYFKEPVEYDLFTGNYDHGGQLKLVVGGTSTVLLERTDSDNGASADLADQGTLYAIYHDGTAGSMAVWTRDLATGKLATELRNYQLNTALFDSTHSRWEFKIDHGVLYMVTQRLADRGADVVAFEVWSTDLKQPSSMPLNLLQAYPASIGDFSGSFNGWGVNNGHVVMSFSPSGSTYENGVADFDTATGKTQYWDLGPTTSICALSPVWIPGSGS